MYEAKKTVTIPHPNPDADPKYEGESIVVNHDDERAIAHAKSVAGAAQVRTAAEEYELQRQKALRQFIERSAAEVIAGIEDVDVRQAGLAADLADFLVLEQAGKARKTVLEAITAKQAAAAALPPVE